GGVALVDLRRGRGGCGRHSAGRRSRRRRRCRRGRRRSLGQGHTDRGQHEQRCQCAGEPSHVAPPHSAFWSRSPVRIRIAASTGDTKILPSPMLPVFAAAATTSATLSTKWSGTTTSTLIFGRKSTVYSPPR